MLQQEFMAIQKALSMGKSAVLERTVRGVEYRRLFQPGARLILLGGGHVAQAICRFAAQLEFSVHVVDDRPSFANRQCFPQAEGIICNDFAAGIQQLAITAADFVCVVTRGHRHDAACLREILSGSYPYYLGMIGSRRRVRELFGLLEQEGYLRGDLEKIHTPIGLDIGAVTPNEIGISVCAELVRCRAQIGRDGTVLPQTNVDSAMVAFLCSGEGAKALALVLEAKGSTPVKAGAVMAMDALGRCYGTIGGGCGEAAVMARARQLLRVGGAEVMEVDMTNDVAEAQGMVCGGRMWVWIETQAPGSLTAESGQPGL